MNKYPFVTWDKCIKSLISTYLKIFDGLAMSVLSCNLHGGHEFEPIRPGKDKRLSVMPAQGAGSAQLISQSGHIVGTHKSHMHKAIAAIIWGLMMMRQVDAD